MSHPRKNIPQRRYRQRPPLTVMQLPLTHPEVLRLQSHMRRHGALGLTPRQHDAIWDFLFERPESQAWLSQMTAQIQAGQIATRPSA
ncbi:hypothetical protein [Comamonas thiooxydans]|uniref:hypothetical protein n=1 Tax=Comamonas thiooxydans TaxID=363952 RepID=UPI001CCB5183|nr:hypothetical protein [Comamonas thiooxydans]MCO8248010.1 hypothetical protein [Comamonas thiooxydans]UBQ41412.1 hypothetical protein LCH15_22285 [Comamonas thiooxydans]